MSNPSELKVVSATRDEQGGYLEQVLAKLAQAEREVEQYRRAWEQAEAEIDRMAHQLQRAHDQGFILEDAPEAASAAAGGTPENQAGSTPLKPVCDAADPASAAAGPGAAGPGATGPTGRSWWRKLSCGIVSLRFCCRD